MMQNTAINVAVGAVALGVSTMTGIGGVTIVSNITQSPKPYGLHLVALEYNGGMINQNIQPINTNAVPAEWAAKFIRSGRVLCAGGGRSNYDGTLHKFTPQEWTGMPCPELQAGDVGSASWTYKDVNGNLITISGKVNVK